MKAAVFGKHGDLEVVDLSMPEPPQGHIRVAVTAAGICGSDLHLKRGVFGPNEGIQPGHEFAGVVEAVGDAVALSPGTPVAVEPLVGCGSCHQCSVGRANLCPTTRLVGLALPGGLAERVCVPADLAYELPSTLSREGSALCEPMAVCVRGVRIGHVSVGDRVAVLGAGSIGLLSILAARAAGAREVLITARYEHQRDLARHLGADQVFADTDELLRTVGDQHVDVVLETVGGQANTLTESIQVARTGGTIVVLGVFEGMQSISGLTLFFKELTLAASNCYGREAIRSDFEIATQLVCDHDAEVRPLVTHVFSLDEVRDAFATAEDKSTRSIKVQIHA
jgi:L-iditol 2-dehydrogenase